MLDTSQDRVDLWFVHCDDVVDSGLLDRYQELLADKERKREASFQFEKDRVRYRATRVLVRTVLSKYLTLPAESWSFSENAYGRPAIANETPEARSISFNVAHSGKVIVLAVTKTAEIGVDVECIERDHVPIEIADRFFSSTEVASLRALPKKAQLRRFFEYWTLKESYLKARGLGLSLPLDQVSFDLEIAGAISFRAESDHDRTGWRFWQAEYFGEYLVSICAESMGEQMPELAVRRMIPLKSEELLPTKVVRRSTR
jgi:4'-phosphopantetheinyl transferase